MYNYKILELWTFIIIIFFTKQTISFVKYIQWPSSLGAPPGSWFDLMLVQCFSLTSVAWFLAVGRCTYQKQWCHCLPWPPLRSCKTQHSGDSHSPTGVPAPQTHGPGSWTAQTFLSCNYQNAYKEEDKSCLKCAILGTLYLKLTFRIVLKKQKLVVNYYMSVTYGWTERQTSHLHILSDDDPFSWINGSPLWQYKPTDRA